MKISIDWIKDFTDTAFRDAAQLATDFTMTTCEVEEVLQPGKFLEGVYVSEITEVSQHPDADKLSLVTVETGTGTQTVVCGAPNVRPGLKVPYAPVGTTFPNGLTLVPKKIRGVESSGMLCAQDELELGTDHSGLMELDSTLTVGETIAQALNIETDTIFDIDNKSITHRPDLWGHHGMAREFALLCDTPLKNTFNHEWREGLLSHTGTGSSPIVPSVEESACKAYYGLSLSGITVEESPAWMQQRLINCDLRPINNIVDISNYVMLELGIPLHIFDRDEIHNDTIRIHRLTEDTPFTTLDEEERLLKTSETVVSDSEEPLVIAGIMGGLRSGVTPSTQNIFIEVANWDSAEIRKTSARIGLRTDSSQRYEKSLDSQLLERTILRTLELVLQLCPAAKVEGNIELAGPDTEGYTPLKTHISPETICRVLGKEIDRAEIIRILTALDFTVQEQDDLLKVEVPSFRATKDIEGEADIIEEIGRIIGYDNILPEPTYERITPKRFEGYKNLKRRIQDFLVFNGNCTETMTYPMVGRKLLEKAEWSELNEKLTLANAISQDHAVMRPSLLPSHLAAAQINCRNMSRYAAFEIGRIYREDSARFSREEDILAITFFNREESTFMELQNTALRLIRYLGIPAQITQPAEKHPNDLVDRSWSGLHPFETLDIKLMGKNAGFLTTLHPLLAKRQKISGNLSMLFLNLAPLEKFRPKNKTDYKPLPRFPGSTFDCTVQVPQNTAASQVIQAVKKLKLKHLEDVRIADVYAPDAGDRSITVTTSFLDRSNTLDHAFIEDAQKKIIAGLEKAGFPLKA
ncbi:MAG: phenylalanine--tRNA ligase subunit beta [Fibrobacterota bacterium]